MNSSIKASEAEKHQAITTFTNDSVGLGRLVNGIAYKSGGNGWYYPIENCQFFTDGGKGYMETVRKLFGGK